MSKFYIMMVAAFVLFSGCREKGNREIIVFHAGSLSVPFKQLADEYEKINPGIKLIMEPAGSLVCARKITDLKKPCDIIASSDYTVINNLLIPDYAKWSIRFATNEIVIAFQKKSRYATEINQADWADILLKKDVTFSRSDPDSDPCGYRTLMVFKLAEKYYNRPGLSEKLSSKDMNFIRPKEVDLVALVEANAVDYMFQYKSVAIQHDLKFIELPPEMNLGDPSKNDIYKTVSEEVAGNSPGSRIRVTGEFIDYSIAVLADAPHSSEAIDFVSFLLSKEGTEIMRRNGQEPLIPAISEQPEFIPEKLKKYLDTAKTDHLK